MLKKVIMALLIVMLAGITNFSYASSETDREDFLKTKALMGVNAGGESAEPAFAPASSLGFSGMKPSYTLYPTRDDGSPWSPVAENKYFYCVAEPHTPSDVEEILYHFIKSDHFSCVYPNLMTFQKINRIDLRLYHSFRDLAVVKNGYVIKVKKDTMVYCDNNNMINFFFKAKPLNKVSLRVSINVSSILNGVNVTEERVITDDFEKCDAILAKMTATAYGNGCTMFKTIAETFPGLIEKVAVKDKNNPNLITLFKPVISIEMVALDMNGKGKHVTIFPKQFLYSTIKTSAGHDWTK
ncbi:MAG TPA: hypothetical protein PKK26_00410 [Candidatus Wallbacteria bacterium]|nr:hypothetical protein [Candidatus Wallbacteria bacterium]